MRSAFHGAFLLLWSLYAVRSAAQVCYNQQGVENPNLVPCNEGGGCCAPGDICWSNGLCRLPNRTDDTYFYNACTDPSWQSEGCISQCLDITTGEGVQTCPGASGGTGRYCCLGFSSSCDCADPELAVSIPTGSIVTTVPFDYFESISQSSTTTSSETSITSSGTKSVATSTSAEAVPAEATASSTSSDSSGGLSSGAKIGAGVGGAIAGLAIIAGILFLIIRRRSKSSNQSAELRYEHMRPASDRLPAELSEGKMHAGRGELEGKGPGFSEHVAPSSVKWRNDRAPVEAPGN
jgi:hypothetical protein